jgi:hypothetical protein
MRTLLLSALILGTSFHTADSEEVTRLHGEMSFRVSDNKQNLQFGIKGGQNSPYKAQAFFLPNPNRVVLDLVDLNSNGSNLKSIAARGLRDTVEMPNSELIERVRVASHPGKVRFVFDMKNETKPLFRTLTNSDSIGLAIAGSGEKLEDSVVEQALALASTANVSSPATLGEDSTLRASLRDLPAASNTTKEVTGPPILKEIKFLHLAPSSTKAVRLDFDNRANFTLVKEDERTYALRIPNGALGSASVSHPFFPPSDFSGVTLVHPMVEDSELVIKIGVAERTSIIALPKEDSIWIKSNKS